MSLTTDIKAILLADSEMTSYLSTRIFTRNDLGNTGAIHDTYLSIYDSDEVMQPFAVINPRDELPTGNINDLVTTEQSVKQMVEIYFYDDGNHGHNLIAQARIRAKALLHGARAGRAILLKQGPDQKEKYDKWMEMACFERSDYAAFWVENNDSNYY